MDTTILIVIALLVVALAVGAALYMRRRRSKEMRSKYGAEYIAAVDETGDRRKAESELKAREKRVRKFDIRPLTREEVERFSDRWRRAQADFVDDPGQAISRADELLGEVMRARGYPVSDFEQRAADLSVDHPRLVTNYRLAHEVARMHERGDAGTEDMRKAMIHYRELFEDLLDPSADGRSPDERRDFSSEEHPHERAPRIRDEEDGRRSDDRAVRERRLDGGDDGRTSRH